MWGPDLHSINPKILLSHVEIFISNLISCHVTVFLIYKVRFIRNY
jgi:hypothetical protein